MHNMFNALQRCAIYAGAKPSDRPARPMVITKRKKDGTIVTIMGFEPAPTKPEAPSQSAATLSGVPFVATRNRARSAGLTWDK